MTTDQRLGDPGATGDTGDDIEKDQLQAFHLYVPTPGDSNITANAAGSTDDGSHGTVLCMGGTVNPASPGGIVTNSYTGFGVRTFGHIFLDGRGDPTKGLRDVVSWSRITVQSTGQAVVQTLQQPLYLLSGDTAVLASNNDTFVSSSKSVNLLAGWAGTVGQNAGDPTPSLDPGPDPGATDQAPANPILPSYVSAVQTQSKWCELASSLDSTVSAFRTALGARADVGDNEAAQPSPVATAIGTLLGTASAGLTIYGQYSSLIAANKPVALNATGRDGADQPPNPPAEPVPGGGSFPPSGNLLLSAASGIRACAPVSVSLLGGGSVSMSGGATASLSSLGATSVFGGVSAELASLGNSTVSAISSVRVTSAHHVHVQARKGDVGVRGHRVQIGYAKDASEWSAPPQASNISTLTAEVGAVTQAGAATVALLHEVDSKSADPAVLATAAMYGAGATLALTELTASIVERTSAQSAPPSGSAPDEVTALDAYMPDFVSIGGPDMKKVLAADGESVMQHETEDVFVKAKQQVRLKSNDTIRLGAAKQITARVGGMDVTILHDPSAGDSITIGASASPFFPTVEIKKPTQGDPSVAIKTAATSSIVLDPTNGCVITAGQTTLTVAHDGAVDVESHTGISLNGHVRVSAP